MIYEQQVSDVLQVSYYNDKGEIEIKNIPVPRSQQYIWTYCSHDDKAKDQQFISFDLKPVKKEYRRYLDKYRKRELMIQFPDFLRDAMFSPHMPKMWFMDIETESLKNAKGEYVFPDETVANGRVLSTAFCDQNGNLYIQAMIKLDEKQIARLEKRVNEYVHKQTHKSLNIPYKVSYLYYETETLMLNDLFSNWIPRMPLLTGWNFLKYDMRYLVNRCKKLGINYKKFSPTGETFLYGMSDKFNKTVHHQIELPCHRGIVDYMMIYEKWDTTQKLKTSLNLNDVGQEVLGLQKVHYSGSLMDLYENNFEDFTYYNAIDTVLVSLIDAKLQTFASMQAQANMGQVALHESFWASTMVENGFQKIFLKEKKVFVYTKTDRQKSKYKGGYVKEPVPGIFEDVLILDFTSKFPSIMAMLNLGIDTLLGEKISETEFRDEFGGVHALDMGKHIIAPNNLIYDKTKDSSCRKLVNELLGNRVHHKTKAAEISEQLQFLKSLIKA